MSILLPMPMPISPLTAALTIPELKHFIQYAANTIQVNEDMVLINVLGALFTAINGKFIVVRNCGHSEVLQAYFLVIAESGERKSAIVKLVKKPILEFLREKRKTQLDKKSIKNGAQLQIYFEDVTPISLKNALAENCGRLASHSAEPELLKIMAQSDFSKSVFCNGYDAEEIRVNRSGKKPIDITNSGLVICVSSQPRTAYEFARSERVIDSGLRGRLFVMNFPSVAGWRNNSVPPIPSDTLDNYDKLIIRLMNIPDSVEGDRHKIQLMESAEQTFQQFSQATEFELRPGGMLSFDKSWGSKLQGKILRLAGILHCVKHDDPCSHLIDDDTIRSAISMGCEFINHAREFILRADYGETLDVAQEILSWAFRLGISKFDIHVVRNGLPHLSTKKIQAGIEHLVIIQKISEDLSAYEATRHTSRRGRNFAPQYLLHGYIPQTLTISPNTPDRYHPEQSGNSEKEPENAKDT